MASWREAKPYPKAAQGTWGCHGDTEARDPVACAALRAALTDEEYSYVVAKAGEQYLDRYFPVRWVSITPRENE